MVLFCIIKEFSIRWDKQNVCACINFWRRINNLMSILICTSFGSGFFFLCIWYLYFEGILLNFGKSYIECTQIILCIWNDIFLHNLWCLDFMQLLLLLFECSFQFINVKLIHFSIDVVNAFKFYWNFGEDIADLNENFECNKIKFFPYLQIPQRVSLYENVNC